MRLAQTGLSLSAWNISRIIFLDRLVQQPEERESRQAQQALRRVVEGDRGGRGVGVGGRTGLPLCAEAERLERGVVGVHVGDDGALGVEIGSRLGIGFRLGWYE